MIKLYGLRGKLTARHYGPSNSLNNRERPVMPRKVNNDEPTILIPASDEPDNNDDTDENVAKESAAKEEQSFLNEFGLDDNIDNFKAKIYRLEDGKQIYCADVGPAEFPFEKYISKNFGGGTYRAILYKNGRFFTNKNYTIANRIGGEVINGPNSQISDIGKLLGEQNRQIASFVSGQSNNGSMGGMKEMLEMMILFKQVMGEPKRTILWKWCFEE